jgi:poly(3-hydroxyalkanoate) synthetase
MRLLILYFIILTAHAGINPKEYPKDWTVHQVCQTDSRYYKQYCLEIIELEYQSDKPKSKTALLIPGLYQNAFIWDLRPKNHISIARYMMREFGIHPFILHVRGIGSSQYIKRSNMDDIAIDDIPAAIDFLYQKTKQPITLMGHSQGAITAMASLGGLTPSGFRPEVAKQRQMKVERLALLAGDLGMNTSSGNFLLPLISLYKNPVLNAVLMGLDKIDIELLSSLSGPASLIPYWDNLYMLENVSYESRWALWNKTVDSTTSGILSQFAQAVIANELRTRTGLAYSRGANNIKIPTFQQVYEYDELAEPKGTYMDSFTQIGSEQKYFHMVHNRSHEDFFMEKQLHSDLDPVLEFLLK